MDNGQILLKERRPYLDLFLLLDVSFMREQEFHWGMGCLWATTGVSLTHRLVLLNDDGLVY